MYSEIFTGESIADGPFRDGLWEKVLLPAGRHLLEGQRLDAALEMLARAGDAEVVVTETETDEQHSVSVVAPVSSALFRDVQERTDISHFAFVALFGRSGRWGIVVEEDYLCLGGEEELVEIFAQEAGGKATLRGQFLRFAETEWSGSLDRRDRILESVGWFGGRV